MTKRSTLGAAIALLMAVGALAQQDPSNFARAKSLYEQALTERDLPRRAELLERSIALTKTFEAYYALGKTRFDLDQYERARESYEQAIPLTDDSEALGATYYKIGLTCEKTGNLLEGIQWLNASLDRSGDRAVRGELKRMRLAAMNAPQSEQQIGRALVTGKSLGSAKIDLQVNFAFNQSDLTVKGKSQSDGLGKLLADNPYQGYKFVFAGHTDEKGTDAYNNRLSLDRAESVKKYIIERYSVAASRIVVEGHGKREPLYPPGPEENDSLNRRVEVKLVPAR